MRATLSAIGAAAVLAAGAGTASAHTDTPNGRADAARPAAAMRTQSLRDEQRAAIAASREPAPQQSVHVTRVADGGFDWADAGIGAGLTAALLLSAVGVSSVRRQHTPATR
jgi:hypothetical protein